MTSQGLFLAVTAGAFAAIASVCAKLAMASEPTLMFCQSVMELVDHLLVPGSLSIDTEENSYILCDTISIYIRIAFFCLVFVFNAVMWTLFVKSMQLCSTTVVATITNTASNLFFTAVNGRLLFGETLPLLWWAGISFVVAGMVFIQRGNGQQMKKES